MVMCGNIPTQLHEMWISSLFFPSPPLRFYFSPRCLTPSHPNEEPPVWHGINHVVTRCRFLGSIDGRSMDRVPVTRRFFRPSWNENFQGELHFRNDFTELSYPCRVKRVPNSIKEIVKIWFHRSTEATTRLTDSSYSLSKSLSKR